MRLQVALTLVFSDLSATGTVLKKIKGHAHDSVMGTNYFQSSVTTTTFEVVQLPIVVKNWF